MMRPRRGWWGVDVASVSLFLSASLFAIGPAYIVVHGGELQAPLVLRPGIGSLVFLWGGGTRYYDTQHGAPVPTGLDGRRYLSYDVYWGRFAPEDLKPEEASQHGRLYLATASQPAAVILTPPNMHNPEPGATRVNPVPIPSEVKDFAFGRAITPSEVAALVAAGVPMK